MPKKDIFNTKAVKSARNNASITDTLLGGINNVGSSKRASELDRLAKNVDDVINNDSSQISRNDVNSYDEFFRNSVTNGKNKDKLDSLDKDTMESLTKLFDTDAENMFAVFKKQYSTKNALYDDLDSIIERIYDLKEALFTTRDGIITPDELNKTISREISFKSSQQHTSGASLKTVEEIESKYKLFDKIKNQITVGSLLYGVFYTYQVPYSYIFEDYQRRQRDLEYKSSVTESVSYDSIILEQASKEIMSEYHISQKDAKILLETCGSDIKVINDPSYVLESVNMDYVGYKLEKGTEKSFLDKFKESRKGSKTETGAQDGTVETEDFSEIRDCYFELIEPRNIIPIRIMEETIGYYYIRKDPSKNIGTNKFGEQLRRINKGEDDTGIKNTVLNRLVDNIIASFDKKYLENNSEFKDLILAALMYDDNYRKDITFQFIPADFIVEHSVNDKRSMLEPSLFFGKLYLALLIYTTYSIIGRSGDQKIYWTRNSGVDKNLANQTQTVARSIKKNRLNFNDLMTFNTMITRVGQSKELFIPVGAGGERSLDFDIMEGQRVDTYDDLMDKLHRGAVNATSVPSVIMNFVNEADYAKTLVMANAKHLSRCVSYQSDLNPSITEMYRKLLLFSTNMDEDLINSLEFKFSLPSGLNSMNYADLINNVDQVAAFAIKAITGENTDQTENDNMVKDILYQKIVRKYLSLDWEMMDSLYEDSKVEAKEKTMKKEMDQEQ